MIGMYPDMFEMPGYGTSVLDSVGIMSVFGVLVIVYLLIAVLSSIFSVISYVLHSVGLYVIADRRKIHHAWLAWIPVGDLWLLGSIADQYQYVAKGKIKNRRKVMLGLSIAIAVAYIACFVGGIVAGIAEGMSDGQTAAGFGLGIAAILLAVAVFVVAIVLSVFQYISYYNLFESCNPNNATVFLVLSIVFPVTLPFFVFACRKQDVGMPPKKKVQAAPEQLPEETTEEAANTEEVKFEEPVEEISQEPGEELEAVEEGFARPEEFED